MLTTKERHLLEDRKFSPDEALAIVPPLCDALQFAHDRGIVHRNIKPENILLDRDGIRDRRSQPAHRSGDRIQGLLLLAIRATDRRRIATAGGITFTSPRAVQLINLSALGFLASLAFLGFLPIPGAQKLFDLSGFGNVSSK